MWGLKCFAEHQGGAALHLRYHDQVLKDWEFPINCHDKIPQFPEREKKAEVADAIALLESKHYRIFIFCSDAIFVGVIDSEREGG